jgi:autotransporter-associated beta strand protein
MLAWTSARGIDYTWNAGSGEWGTAANWNPSTGVPGTGDVVLLTNGGTIDLGGNRTVARVGATGAGNGIVGTLTGGSLHFTTSMYVRSGTVDVNLSNAGGSTGRLWIGGDTGAIVLLSGNNTHTYSDNYATIIGHSTTGPAGIVRLGGNNALGGTDNRTDVYSGTLDLNGQNAVVQNQIRLMSAGTAFLVNSNTTAEAGTAANVVMQANNSIGGAGNMTLGGIVSGGGTLTKIGAGRLTLSGTNTFSGALTVLDGTLSVPVWNANNTNGPLGNSSSRVVLGGSGSMGTLEFTATGGYGTARRGLELAAGGTGMVHLAPATGNRNTNYIHIDGSNITGGGAFIVDTSYGTTQTSRFIIVGSTGITGPVTVNPYSELQSNLANDGTPFGTGTITVSANAILGVYNTSPTVTATLGGLAGSGILQATDSAGLKTFRIGSNNEDTHFSGVIRDGATNRTVAISKVGTGTLTLSGVNTYTGDTRVENGTLSITSWNTNSSNGPLGNSSTSVVLGGAGTTGTFQYTGGNIGTGVNLRGIEVTGGSAGVVHLLFSDTGTTYPPDETYRNRYIHTDGSRISGSGALTIDTRSPNGQIGGRFIITNPGGTAFSGPLTVAPNSELQLSAPSDEAFAFGSGTVTVNAGGILNLWRTGDAIVTLGGLAGDGLVRGDASGLKTYRIGSNGLDTEFAGAIVNGRGGATVALTKIGTGTLTLSGNNTFTGVLSVEDGTLSIGTWNNNNTAGPLGQSANKVQLNGGTIQYTGGSVGPNKSLHMAGPGTIDVVEAGTVLNLGAAGSNTLTGSGDITKQGLGTLQLAQAAVAQSSWSGKLIINAGTVDFFGSDSMPKPASFVPDAVQINDGGTFAFSYSGTSPSGSLPNTNIGFQLSGNAGFAITAGTHTLQGVIANKPGETGSLIKTGAGTLVLSGNNTYSGTTTVTAGTLRVGAGGTTGTLGDGNIVNNSALVFHRSDAMTIGQVISGSGTLTKEGSGMLTLTGDNTFTGQVTVAEGTLSIGTWNNDNTAGPLGQSANKVRLDGGTIQYTGGNVGPNKSLNMAGPGTIDVVQAGTVLNLGAAGSNSLTGSGDITKEGLGTLQLAQAVVAQGSWGGKLIINQGTVDFFGGGSMPTWSAGATPDAIRINDGATFALSYGGNSTIPTNGGFQLSGNATIFVNSHTHSYAGIIADKPGDTGNLIKTGAGTLVLSGNNTYSGTTTISSGTIQVGAGGTSGTLGQGNIINNGALVINRSGDMVLAQDISGSGTLTKEGSGTLTLAGATNYGGSTYINDGTVLGALNFRNDLYIKSGTVNANLSNTGYTSRRVWIGGDAGATVTLGGDNSYTFTDNYATIIGLGANVAGTVKLGSSTALGVSTNRTHVYSGMLDFSGTVGLVQDRISLLGANAVLANSTGAASTNAAIYLGEGSWGAGGNISVADGASLTLGGVVTSSAPTHPNLNKLGPGTLILTNSANSYHGTTNINAGILGIASTGALPGWNAAGRYSVALGAILAIDYTQFDANAVAMLSTGNFQSGSSIGRMFNTTPGSFTHGADMANAAHPGAPTALVKLGPNTLTLTGNSTYTGPTVVDAGTLLVNGSTHANSAVAVRPGATLGGTGTVGGPTTIQAGGKLATGNSIGTLNFGSPLTLDAGAVWDWEFIHKSPGNHDQAAGPQLVLPTAGAVTFNIHGLPGHSVFPGDKFTVFTGDVENFSPERVALVNHSKWTSWQMSAGNSLVLTADPTISLSTDVLNAGQANPGAWNTRGNGYSNAVGVELVRFVDRFSTSLDAVAYTQAGTDTIDVSGWVVTSGTGGQRGASQGLQVNGYSSSNTAHTNPGGANPQNLYLRGEPNEYNEGFGAHANWIVTFDLDVIRQEHFAGTRMPFQLSGEFGTWGGIGSTGVNDGVIQGAIFLDGVRIDDMDPSIANPQASIRNLEFDLTIYSGRYLTFGIFNDPNSTVWDDGVFKNVHLTMIPEPGTWLMLLAAGAAGLLFRRRSKR